MSINYLLKIQAQEGPVYRLASSFLEIGKYEEFIAYSSGSIEKYSGNIERNAMIYFYQAFVYYQIENKKKRKRSYISQ